MELKYIGQGRGPFFAPDCIGNFRTDVPETDSLTVFDANGIPVCGRVVEGANTHWELQAKDWEYK